MSVKKLYTDLVAKNFSKSSEAYGDTAKFQKHSAEKIADLVLESVADKKVEKVLEIGCGTGFLTTKMITSYPESAFLISDISPQMLEVCKKSLPLELLHDKISFLENDISLDVPGDGYDLIISALTFQWVKDLDKVFENIKEKLNPGGVFVFSTLVEGTFAKLRMSFDIAGADFPGPELLETDDILELIDGWDSIDTRFEAYREEYETVFDFLKHLKSTGAVNATGKTVTPSVMRKVMKIYSEEYTAPDESVEVEYDVIYCAMRKPVIEGYA